MEVVATGVAMPGAAEIERAPELERRRRVAESLADILRVINSARPLPDILDFIVAQARELADASVCVLHHVDYARAMVAIEASANLPAELRDVRGFPLYSSAADEAIMQRRPVLIGDLRQSQRAAADDPEIHPDVRRWRMALLPHYAAFMAVPLVVGGEVYGSLAFYFDTPRPRFTPEEVELATALGNQAALAIDNAQLRLRTAETAVSAERSRLARELHDAVTQTLFSTSLIAEVLPVLWERDPERGRACLAELRDLTRGALAEMRALLLELRPAALTEAALGDLLRQLAAAVAGRAHLAVDVTVDGTRPLPPEVQIALYRVAQEALNNVVKHAGAQRVTLALRLTDENACLTVTDDGLGFDPDAAGHCSLGLGIMRERCQAIGASLDIASAPGEGTQVSVSCPLPPHRDAPGGVTP